MLSIGKKYQKLKTRFLSSIMVGWKGARPGRRNLAFHALLRRFIFFFFRLSRASRRSFVSLFFSLEQTFATTWIFDDGSRSFSSSSNRLTFSIQNWHVICNQTRFHLDPNQKRRSTSSRDTFSREMFALETQRECTFLKNEISCFQDIFLSHVICWRIFRFFIQLSKCLSSEPAFFYLSIES